MSMVAHKFDSDRLVQHAFFEPLDLKWKSCEEKIHLFYDVFITEFLSGLLTNQESYHPPDSFCWYSLLDSRMGKAVRYMCRHFLTPEMAVCHIPLQDGCLQVAVRRLFPGRHQAVNSRRRYVARSTLHYLLFLEFWIHMVVKMGQQVK